jgi:hypothetical protein
MTFYLINKFVFAHYRENNMLLLKLYLLLKTAIRSNHDTSLRAIFGKHKLLTRMIQSYQQPESLGSKAIILLLCNIIRLSADLLGNDQYLKGLLQSHTGWLAFLPVLR